MIRSRATLGLLLLPLVFAACGEEPPPVPPPAPAPLPTLPEIDAATKAADALEHLERGPGDLQGLLVPEVHRRNWQLAVADLVYYETEAARLLADPARIARITGDVPRYGNAWHSVLRLLIAFRARPEALVVPWTEPILALPRDEDHHTLRLEAVRLLALVDGPRAGDVLLRLFAQGPDDREIAMLALAALARRPDLRREAYDIALTHGTASLWEGAPSRVAAGMPRGEIDPSVAGAVAWWQALTSGSGPRMDTLLPILKSPPWAQGRLGLDPAVPPRVVGPDGAPRPRYGSIDSFVAYGSGWYATPTASSPERPAQLATLTGKLPAAEGRCLLASWAYRGYLAAVEADLALQGIDDGLYYAAKHCMLAPSPTSEAETVARIVLELEAPRPGGWTPEGVRELQRLVASLAGCGDPQVWAVLERILHGVGPLDVARPVIEQAYDVMYGGREDDLRAVLRRMFLEGDAAAVGVALHLMRRARDPVYLDLLEQRLEALGPEDPLAAPLRRTITFIYAARSGIEPARQAAFVTRYRAWLAETGDERLPAMASALLDFGDAGVAAFAEGLRGPRRALYLRGWPGDRRLVPREIALAAVEPVDRHTSPAERNHVLALAWASFPVDAAPALEALRRRLPAAMRGPVEAVLDRVRHRAPRHGDA